MSTWGLTVRKGAAWSHTIEWRAAAGAAVDVTGATAAEVDIVSDAGTVLATMSLANGGVAVAAGGLITLAMSAATTAGLAVGVHRWELLITLAAGATSLLAGTVEVVAGVTS